MPQKLCATCNKELTPTERALNEIQCTDCYRLWLHQTVPQAEPTIRRVLDELNREKAAASASHG